jgi:hypothetical protein
MIAGEVVELPRLGASRCVGCRRFVPVGGMVALDLPGGGWALACGACFRADPPGRWRGLAVVWAGDAWEEREEVVQAAS